MWAILLWRSDTHTMVRAIARTARSALLLIAVAMWFLIVVPTYRFAFFVHAFIIFGVTDGAA